MVGVGGALLAACSPAVSSSASGSGTPAESVSASPTPPDDSSVSPTPSLSGVCANQYFPVLADASWTYERVSVGKTTQIRQKFERILDSGFTVLMLLPGGGERDVWTCSEAGLANVEQYVTGPGGAPLPPGDVQFRHFRSHGVSVPADLHVGSSWNQVVTSEARFTLKGNRYREKQVVTTKFEAVGEETVTTPAGTFQALKVEITSRTHKTEPRLGVNLNHVTVSTQWWAAGVGVVRMIVDTGSGSPTEIVLQMHDIAVT